MLRRLAAATLLAALLALPAHAAPTAGAPKPWTWDDMLAIRTVREPRLSPDGTRLLYVVRELTADTSRYQSDVWMGTIATGEHRRLTRSSANDDSPRWAPDGRSFAFLSDRTNEGAPGGSAQVWSLSLEGGEPMALTSSPTPVMQFEWFADGRAIAYLAPDGASAAARERAARGDDAWVASEHPGGTRLWMLELAGRKAAAITPAGAFVTSFAVSPDGRRAVYSAQAEPGFNGAGESDLWAIPVAGGKPAALVQRPGMDARPRFSPDGRWVAFLSHDGRPGDASGPVHVCVVPAAGGGAVNITPRLDERIQSYGSQADLLWMSDNQSVLFGSADRTSIRLFRAFTDDRPVEPVTREAGANDWPTLDAAGKVFAWVHEDPEHAPEVWVWEFERSAPRAFTDLNPWIRDRLSFPAQVVTWPSADGRQVEGLLYAPVNARPGVRVPLLLDVHGGPGVNHAQYFTPLTEGYGIPYYLQRGWAVLMPNPRGSSGYRGEWRAANVRDWAGKPYEDLMSGVDAMIRLGFADSTRLAVCGWSYGGYMTSNIVGRTNRFRAAVAGGGPVNLLSFAGTTDIPGLAHHSMSAWPWDDPQVYLDNSPLLRAGAVRTPTAFIHGEQDPRVPAGQSWEMYRALRTRGVPTDLMILPREGHDPESPRHRRTMMIWNHEWLARWTLNAPPAGARRATGGSR